MITQDDENSQCRRHLACLAFARFFGVDNENKTTCCACCLISLPVPPLLPAVFTATLSFSIIAGVIVIPLSLELSLPPFSRSFPSLSSMLPSSVYSHINKNSPLTIAVPHNEVKTHGTRYNSAGCPWL